VARFSAPETTFALLHSRRIQNLRIQCWVDVIEAAGRCGLDGAAMKNVEGMDSRPDVLFRCSMNH
jgi:hypothetical protein